jgi:hypothetical protein
VTLERQATQGGLCGHRVAAAMALGSAAKLVYNARWWACHRFHGPNQVPQWYIARRVTAVAAKSHHIHAISSVFA